MQPENTMTETKATTQDMDVNERLFKMFHKVETGFCTASSLHKQCAAAGAKISLSTIKQWVKDQGTLEDSEGSADSDANFYLDLVFLDRYRRSNNGYVGYLVAINRNDETVTDDIVLAGPSQRVSVFMLKSKKPRAILEACNEFKIACNPAGVLLGHPALAKNMIREYWRAPGFVKVFTVPAEDDVTEDEDVLRPVIMELLHSGDRQWVDYMPDVVNRVNSDETLDEIIRARAASLGIESGYEIGDIVVKLLPSKTGPAADASAAIEEREEKKYSSSKYMIARIEDGKFFLKKVSSTGITDDAELKAGMPARRLKRAE